MKRLVSFQLDGDNSIVVEVDEPEPEGAVRAMAHPENLLDPTARKFADALDKIQAATEKAVTSLRNLTQQPDEITMEFGFNFSADFGAVIAKATAEANYKVTLNWKRGGKEQNG